MLLSRSILLPSACIFVCCLEWLTPHLCHAGEKELLNGERLFNDYRLSASGDVACATCHDPAFGFADPNATSSGSFGLRGSRNAPSLLNMLGRNAFFWDGRRATLEELLFDPLTNPREHGLSDKRHVVETVAALYSRADGRPITSEDVVSSLATYVRSLASNTSPYDRFVAGDSAALTEAQKRGLQLFDGRAQCGTCHSVVDGAFSDSNYHPGQLAADAQKRLAHQVARAASMGIEERYRALAEDADFAELGRFVVTLLPRDVGAFQTPSLRNVAVTSPYMHDGHVSNLREAVEREIYWRNYAGRLGTLTPADKDDLIEFLQSLTSQKPTVPRRRAPEKLATSALRSTR